MTYAHLFPQECDSIVRMPSKTINLPTETHLVLGRMALDLQQRGGKTVYKQDLVTAMVRYFKKNPKLLEEELAKK